MPLPLSGVVEPVGDGGASAVWVHAVPGAKRTEVAGLHGDALRLRVRAPAQDGLANAEISAWFATLLRVPQRTVTITLGRTARRKRVRVGRPYDVVVAALSPLLPQET